MSTGSKIAIGGVAVGLLLWPLIGFWLSLLVVIGVPAAAYLMLDPSQRRRLRRIRRKELGR
jgi:membrane protein implicated in regulation of membrane protease activity